ncbi:MAG: aminotransferase class I/II-fold pyridoxal phosphate-dependent enzyme [Candidatus Zixiibacteriota bacterium]|nr:MAG: aminotransferase class I/II-fold pyridoxal phosphate-dependent enzyme [candidate division Zixibacteria bacterium]
MIYAKRYLSLPPYLFADLERKAAEMKQRGVDVIHLGIGDPDLPPPAFFTEALHRHLDDSDAHLYPTSQGDPEVRRTIARWFQGRFGVELDPDREICVLIGAKEGLANFARLVVNPDDVVACPDPAYPVYAQAGAILNEGLRQTLMLDPERGFLPDLTQAEGVRLLFLNYPNNPTGATAPESFFRDLAAFADSHPGTVVAHDAAYSEMTFGDYRAPSLLQYTRRAVEFHSLSKLFNATGYRIGFLAGNPELVLPFTALKAQLDSGAPVFIQRAMADGLARYQGADPPPEVRANLAQYERRRALVEEKLAEIGWEVTRSQATFYVWARVSGEEMETVNRAALEKGVIMTPGRGFGLGGKGYVRLALSQPYERLEEAMERLRTL